jgi:hypothetical protein
VIILKISYSNFDLYVPRFKSDIVKPLGEAEWKSATCVLIESMKEMAAYIHGGQGAWHAC